MSSGMIKTTIREIKGSFGRYMAIFAIVMLGVGFFSGLKATTPAMIATENTYLTQQNFFDFRLLSTIGFTEKDVEELMSLSEVADAEGGVCIDAVCALEEESEAVYKFHTITERINKIVVTAGRMPEKAGECVLDDAFFSEEAIGSQITVTDNNLEDTLNMFGTRTFTVVGVARSPYYINFERGTASIGDGKVSAFLYVPKEAFDCDYLTEIYVSAKQKYDVYTDEYEDYIDALIDEMEEKTGTLVFNRYDELVTEARDKIDDAQEELDEKEAEAEKELNDAWQEIQDGEQELADGEQEIIDGEQKIADGKKEIADHEQELTDGEQELADGEQEIREKEQELIDAEEEVRFHEWEIFDNELKLAGSKDELEAAKKELQKKEANLLEQEELLLSQEEELIRQEQELAAKETELGSQAEAMAGMEGMWQSQETLLNEQLAQLEQAYNAGSMTEAEYTEAKNGILAGLGEIQMYLGQLQALRDGLGQVQSGLVQIQEGLSQLQAGKSEIQWGKEQIREAKNKLAYNEQVLLEAEIELAQAKEQVTNARAELEDGKEQLAQAKVDLEEGRRELEEGRAELAQAKIDLAEAQEELKEGRIDLEEGKAELSDAKVTYADARTEFEEEVADAQLKIDDAREELAGIEEPDDYVLTRNTNMGYACYESDSNIVAAIANVFPLFFFLVAALICMTTMNRMVEEQRTQIGVLKALGYGNGAIMGKFLFYAGSAALLGAVTGCVGGTWLFPKVIWTGYSIMYSMGEIEYHFDFWMAMASIGAAPLCSMGAAYISCRYELYSVPANLIRPKAPKNGKRIFLEKITFIWSRMKFLHKVSVRNIIRYKKMFFMMILGISGCTALLVTGFGVKDSVTNVADMQYGQVQIYDMSITFKDGVKQDEKDIFAEQTRGILAQTAYLYEESVDMDFSGKTKSVYMEIPENEEEISDFVNLHTKEGEPISYPETGEAVLTVKAAESMGIKVGDQVVIRDNDMNSLTVRVTALCENFVNNYIYLNKETYEEQLGTVPEYKSAYTIVQEDVNIHEAAAVVSENKSVLAVSVIQDMRDRIVAMMESMNYIVILIIACAGSLAFIVLYNLTNINITERIREIATIKVLGFYARETADYVFRENLVLTGMGAVVGLGLGKWLHWFVMYNINLEMISFKTVIMPVSYLWSLLFTFGFALLVNGLMFFKLEKINMAESLKSIE